MDALLTISLLVPCVGYWYSAFLFHNEHRTDRRLVALDDPLMRWIPCFDCSWPVATLLYTGIVYALLHWYMVEWMPTLWSALTLILTRALCMELVPLDVPRRYHPLRDPILQALVGVSEPSRLDLFFSGHCSTLCLLGHVTHTEPTLYTMAAASGLLMICGRVHYTVDVLVAPAAALLAYLVGHSVSRITANPLEWTHCTAVLAASVLFVYWGTILRRRGIEAQLRRAKEGTPPALPPYPAASGAQQHTTHD